MAKNNIRRFRVSDDVLQHMESNPLFVSIREFFESKYRQEFMQDDKILDQQDKLTEILALNAKLRQIEYLKLQKHKQYIKTIILPKIHQHYSKKALLKRFNTENDVEYTMYQFNALVGKVQQEQKGTNART